MFWIVKKLMAREKPKWIFQEADESMAGHATGLLDVTWATSPI